VRSRERVREVIFDCPSGPHPEDIAREYGGDLVAYHDSREQAEPAQDRNPNGKPVWCRSGFLRSPWSRARLLLNGFLRERERVAERAVHVRELFRPSAAYCQISNSFRLRRFVFDSRFITTPS
jgi:hypothetical protein